LRAGASGSVTTAALCDPPLDRHAVAVRPRTIATLRDRLRYAIAAFGDVPLRDLERMVDEIAAWQAQLPPRAGHGIAQALRQVLDAAVRWERMGRNPAKVAGRNPKPPARAVRAFTRVELDAIAAELAPAYQALPLFAAATGAAPRGMAGSRASRRRPPRRTRPRPPQCFQRRDRGAGQNGALASAGALVPRGRRMRSTPSHIGAFELAKVMGTSIEMIDRHYGTLLDGASAGIADRLGAFEAELERATQSLERS